MLVVNVTLLSPGKACLALHTNGMKIRCVLHPLTELEYSGDIGVGILV